MEESVGTRRAALDVPGLLLITAGALGLVWGLVRGNVTGWSSLEVSGSLALGGLVGAFVAWERRAPDPMLPMRFFRRRAFAAGNTAVFCLFGSIFAGVFFFAQFMQVGLGSDALEAGLYLLPWTANLFLLAPLAGILADRVGERPLLVGEAGAASGRHGLGGCGCREPGMAYGELIAPLIVAGVGGSVAIPPAASAVIQAVPTESVGAAAGANSMLRELGGVFGIAAAVAVFAGAGNYASASAFVDGFAPAIALAAGLALVGALVSLALPARRPTPGACRL